jgi:hypothetical protein
LPDGSLPVKGDVYKRHKAVTGIAEAEIVKFGISISGSLPVKGDVHALWKIQSD